MTEDVFGIVGKVIAGTYEVEQVVAEGGFGVVYRAHHGGFRAPVALKCLKTPQQLSSELQAEFLEQFRAEAELLFRLSASIPTVVRPLHIDAVTLDNGMFVPFMALEWLEGETLEAIMERRRDNGDAPLGLKKLVRLLTPVARALERAHNFMGPDGPISVVHRDIKPENIFVARVAGEEVVKILDFGIGKAKSVASQVAGRASQTHSALSSFTPAYGAPEQWVPKRYGQSGPWTDVWGLALTMVELLAGRTVIDGDHAGMMGTVLDQNRRGGVSPSPGGGPPGALSRRGKVLERALFGGGCARRCCGRVCAAGAGCSRRGRARSPGRARRGRGAPRVQTSEQSRPKLSSGGGDDVRLRSGPGGRTRAGVGAAAAGEPPAYSVGRRHARRHG